ncbi:MAG: guanylate kinase [Candidatus Calescibacterium sp.]|nr:guanylate kinase [Candidatus Calescibacterium sp.]MCX7972015.1 guanylate kinase [bacterium]MDW8194701.1 guanylate kinase [Candidatus Calescibacterium sp.]
MQELIDFFQTFKFNITTKGHIFVISGFSGVGKGTVIKELLKRNPNMYFSISYTTRAKRYNEIDGVDYHFVDKETFKKMILNDEFLEWAIVNENFYGTPKSITLSKIENNIDVILDIDVKGAIQVKSKLPNLTTLIYIIPPTGKELLNRLYKRNTENLNEIATRITTSLIEINYINAYDYIVVNDDLQKCIDEVEQIFRVQKMSSKVQLLSITASKEAE